MHAQAGDAIDPRERGLKYAGNNLEDRPPCHAIRDDLAVVQVHAGRQVELLSAYIELGDIGRPFLVRRGRAEVTLLNVGNVRVVRARDMPGALHRPDQRT